MDNLSYGYNNPAGPSFEDLSIEEMSILEGTGVQNDTIPDTITPITAWSCTTNITTTVSYTI